jgi:hypothetical protein
MQVRRLLIVAAAIEGLAGAALLLFPAIVVVVLLGVAPGSPGLMIAMVAGVALLALGVACGGAAMDRHAPTWMVVAITVYNAGAGLLLLAFAIRGMAEGPVVWVAGVLHLGLGAAFCARTVVVAHEPS